MVQPTVPSTAPKPLTNIHWSTVKNALRTNVPPADIHRLISQSGNDIQQCDQEISRLLFEISTLENTRQEIKKYQRSCNSLLAPVRKVPREVLTEIFHYFTAFISFEESLQTPTRRPVRACGTILATVCTHWRDLALALPKVWSTFRVTVDSDIYGDGAKHAGVVDYINTLILRSQECPISFHFDDSWSVNEFIDSVSSATVQRVPHRWLHASFDSDFYSFWESLERFLEATPFPLLETTRTFMCLDSADSMYDFYHNSPKLHEVVVRLTSGIRLEMPWAQVTSLSIFEDFSNYESVFPLLSNLRRLSVVAANREREFLQLSAPCTLPIESLRMEVCGWDGFQSFFAMMTLPSLTSISIRARLVDLDEIYSQSTAIGGKIETLPLLDLASCLARSSARVTELSLLYTPRHALMFTELLDLFPHLTQLSLVEEPSPHMSIETGMAHTEITDSLLAKLTLLSNDDDDAANPFLPRLREVNLEVWNGAFSDHSLVQMVRSRLFRTRDGIFDSLQRIRVKVHRRRIDGKAVDTLSRLRDAGSLDLTVSDLLGCIV